MITIICSIKKSECLEFHKPKEKPKNVKCWNVLQRDWLKIQIPDVYNASMCRRAWVVEREIEIQIGNINWFQFSRLKWCVTKRHSGSCHRTSIILL